jgi:CheY-like chemotaxis protein
MEMGLSFEIANDGLEGVEAFKKGSFDLILMDENMPNMNGIQATKKILELERQQGLKPTPIIAVTANALHGDKERFLAAGMCDYMSKPFDDEDLKRVFQTYL